MISKGMYSGSKDTLLAKISEAEIASFYLDELTEIPSVISSPLRKDEHPSFRIYSPDGYKVNFYDYATGEKGSIIDLVMLMFNCTYNEALAKIDNDISGNTKSTIQKRGNKIKISSEKSDLQVRTKMREWRDYDFEYWSSYGIPKEWLLHADIYPICYIFIVTQTGYVKTIKADKYAYTFVERKDGEITEKVYQPFNREGMKWRSGHDSSVCDLWTKLPERGNSVIITSSRKDALCIWANTGIPSISMQSETTNIKPQVMQELKRRFNRVYVLYDNDFNSVENHGRMDGLRMKNLYQVIQLEIPEEYKSKDPSDLFKNHGKETFVKVISTLIKESLQ